uniref:hypothetical protein n=1 Tax=Escherichia coli TaxID=562 RepID=UPI0015E832F4|nr:hypothetical protein [Escherichia coli]
MGSCAAPSAKGDDKFITTDYLQQCPLPQVMLTYSKIDSYIIPVTASFIGLPVTINGIGTLVLSVCDVNKGKINQHVWQE